VGARPSPASPGAVPGLDELLSDEGWPYASSLPVGPGDPGRFHALFGRDSLITSLQVLPARPDVARATLRALAAKQGVRHDPGTLEDPGKIGHEFRAEPPVGFVGWPAGEFRYYGTADATSWFVVLLAATGDEELQAELIPSRNAAADWLRTELDHGAGLIRYDAGDLGGLSHQGWRDAVDPAADANGGGTLRPNGSNPRPPLADADTQAVTVAAMRALARLTGEDEWRQRHDDMRTLVTRSFLPDAVMEDADGTVEGAGSQLGWLLWADALEPAAVHETAARLCESDILTAFGLRTLSSRSPVFGASAYHRGTIWPFDSWLGWGGLRAAGWHAQAEALRLGVLAAVSELGGYPELYAVTADNTVARVPSANHVQAWTVGACWALEQRWDGRT
jgi:glycogen debranching enzyme